jgi:hypothetical protein
MNAISAYHGNEYEDEYFWAFSSCYLVQINQSVRGRPLTSSVIRAMSHDAGSMHL